MVIRRRTLLLSSAASVVPGAAAAQCVTDTVAVDACRGGVYVGGAPSLDLNFTGGTLDPRIVFTRAAGPATYFDAAGVLQTAGTNGPRFDYDPVTHAPLGLLIEEARTNLLLNSATLATQSVSTTAVAYTLSFYGTGTITKSGTATGALVGTGAFPTRVSQTFTPTAGTLTLTVTGSVLNANLEAGAFPTSYITTTGAAATRAADVASMPTGPWFNAAAGTLAFDYDAGKVPATAPIGGLSDGGGVANIIYPRQDGQCFASVASVSKSVNTGAPNAFPATNKVALSYGPNILSGSSNGRAAVTDNTLAAGPFAWSVRMSFGCSPWALDTQMGGHLSRVRYWPRALSATELQSITT